MRLRDVAELAGVSVKTVSNVVHEHPHVSSAVRSRVGQAIVDLGYRPNVSARSLRRGRTGLIALAVPELDAPYFSELSHLVTRAAAGRGLTVVIEETGGVVEQERAALQGLSPLRVDGVLFSAVSLVDAHRPPGSPPVVLLGEQDQSAVSDRLSIDNVAAARDATRHLLEGGARRIAAIGIQEASRATGALRAEGYRQALREAGRPIEAALLAPARRYHRPDGYAAMRGLLALDDRPDAVFAFNDLLALGAVRAVHDAGLRVPNDVAVVGLDDVEDCRYATPRLSTIGPDKAALADRAVALLEARISGDDAAAAAIPRIVAHELIVRESTGPSDAVTAGRSRTRPPR